MSIAAEHEIVTIPRADALQVYTTPGAIDLYLGKIKTEVDGFLALGMTVETDKGRKAIRSMAFRMARTRAALENIGKALADEVKAIPKKVDATRRLVRDTLEEVEERARLAAEKAERDRVAAVEAAAADERRRAAEEKARQEREAAEREANKRHRAAVNNAAVDAFVAGGIERETAVAVVTLIAKRTIPRIVISY